MGGHIVLHALSTCEDHMVGCNDAIQLKSAELAAGTWHLLIIFSGAWGARWRFSFGIGPDKTAVLIVGCRTRNFNFTVHDVPVPVVSEYCYLGVVFPSSRKWSIHGERLYANSNRKFHPFFTWAENRQLHTGFRRSLFQSYVLPSMLYGCQFFSTNAVNFLDKKLRHWGRRLLQWPSGAPDAAVLGELGWVPFRQEVLRSPFSLFGRLCSADSAGGHRGFAARVFRYALGQEHSWAQEVSKNMRDCGIHAPHVWGVSPGCSGRTVAAWRRHCMCLALDRHAVAARRAEVAAMPSLRLFAECHPGLNVRPHVHSSRVSAFIVREWTLARCGHHPFLDGRSARHRSQIRPRLCGAAVWSFVHALRSCPLFVPWRRLFGLRAVEQLPDDVFLHLLFLPKHHCNSVGLLSAHMHIVAGVCQAQRSLLEGVNL